MTPARDRIAKVLMILLGLATIGAFANALRELPAAPPDRVGVETWRTFAFAVFAGLFIVLGLYPRRVPALWELLIFQKAAVPFYMAFFAKAGAARSITDAGIVPVDTALTVVTVLCYLLAEGWRGWSACRVD